MLDQLWPANVVCVAELDTVFRVDDVDAAWQQVCPANPVSRSRLACLDDAHPVLVDDPSVPGDFQACEGTLESVLADEQRVRFDVAAGPLVRCRYLITGDTSAILLTGHHAVLDGRGGYVLLQQLAGVLAGGEPPEQRSLPPGLQDRIRPGLRWPQDRRVAMGLVREMADRRRRAGPVDELLASSTEVLERRLQVSTHRLDESATSALFARTRAVGATGYGMIAAAWLQAAQDLFADGRPAHHLALSTPADLRARLDPPVPGDVAGMFASLISTSHVIGTADLVEAANEVSSSVQAAVDRGEGELFFALARPWSLDGRGAAMLRSALAATPQSLAVSNTGRLPEGADPEWVRSVWFSFAPTPNQLAFVSATTYRGRLTMAACFDQARVPPDLATRLATDAVARLGGAARS